LGGTSSKLQNLPGHDPQANIFVISHCLVVHSHPLGGLRSHEPFLKCTLALGSFEDFGCFSTLYQELILNEVSMNPCFEYLLLPAFNDEVLDVARIHVFDSIDQVAHSIVFYFLFFFDILTVAQYGYQIALLPSVEQFFVVVLLEGLEEFVAEVVDHCFSFVDAGPLLNMMVSLHQHAFLKDGLYA